MNRRDRLLLAEATASLVAARLALALLPMRRVLAAASQPPRSRPGRTEDAARVAWAVRVVATRGPWRLVCFPQGLAVQAMLRRRGIASTLCYGVGKDGADGFAAHVWVEVAGQAVIGGHGAARFRRLATFPATA